MSTAIPETFLELCQHATRESGMATGGAELPAATQGQTNALAKMVSRVAESWVEIQGEKKWNFLRKTFTFPLQLGVRTYSITGTNPGELNWQDLDVPEAKGIFTVTNASDGSVTRLRFLDWDTWRQTYALTKATDYRPGVPSYFTIDDAGNLLIDSLPDFAHEVSIPYWAQPQTLAADGDKPSIDVKLRRIISWRAVRKFAEDKNDQARAMKASMEENKLFHALMRKYLPPITLGPEPITGAGAPWV